MKYQFLRTLIITRIVVLSYVIRIISRIVTRVPPVRDKNDFLYVKDRECFCRDH